MTKTQLIILRKVYGYRNGHGIIIPPEVFIEGDIEGYGPGTYISMENRERDAARILDAYGIIRIFSSKLFPRHAYVARQSNYEQKPK